LHGPMDWSSALYPHIHTRNGLAKSLNKRIELIARPLFMSCNLPTSRWSRAALHTAYWLTAYRSTSPLQLIRGNPPSISHLRKFGSASRVPISPPQRTSMGPQTRDLCGVHISVNTCTLNPSCGIYSQPSTLIAILKGWIISRH
jgi:hypothetical protein